MKSHIHYKTLPYLDGVDLLTCSNTSHHFPKHFHDGHNIWLNSAGGESVWHRGKTQILQEAEIGIVNPGEVHANHAANDIRCLQSFYISPEAMKKFALQNNYSSEGTLEFHQTVLTDLKLKKEMINIHHLLQMEHDAMEGESLMISLFSQLFFHQKSTNNHAISNDPIKISMVKDYLHTYFDKDIRLNQLANLVGISEHHLIRIFKKHVGMPPHQYLIQIRLQYVVDLLKAKNSITEASLAAGFSDQSHMYRHFKRLFGITPAKYQQYISAS